MRYNDQENIASRICNKLGMANNWAYNPDATLSIYDPVRKIVFTVHRDLSVTWRAAKDCYGRDIVAGWSDANRELARTVIFSVTMARGK